MYWRVCSMVSSTIGQIKRNDRPQRRDIHVYYQKKKKCNISSIWRMIQIIVIHVLITRENISHFVFEFVIWKRELHVSDLCNSNREIQYYTYIYIYVYIYGKKKKIDISLEIKIRKTECQEFKKVAIIDILSLICTKYELKGIYLFSDWFPKYVEMIYCNLTYPFLLDSIRVVRNLMTFVRKYHKCLEE